MNATNNPILTPNAKVLRKSMTREERRLWYDFLKNLPVTVNRQKVIGNYIADFYIAKAKLVIELDGSQHYDAQGMQYDALRDAFLVNRGYRVARYSNLAINRDFRAVCQDILNRISADEWAGAEIADKPD